MHQWSLSNLFIFENLPFTLHILWLSLKPCYWTIYTALIIISKASSTINIDSPIFNHFGFVFKEIRLPILTPIIDPMITTMAGKNIMSPRYQ